MPPPKKDFTLRKCGKFSESYTVRSYLLWYLYKYCKNYFKWCLLPSKHVEIKSVQTGSWIPSGDPRVEILTSESGRKMFASRGSHGLYDFGRCFRPLWGGYYLFSSLKCG